MLVLAPTHTVMMENVSLTKCPVNEETEGATYTELKPVVKIPNDDWTPYNGNISSQSTVERMTEEDEEMMDFQPPPVLEMETTVNTEAEDHQPMAGKSGAKVNTAAEQKGPTLDILIRNVCCKFYLGREVDLRFLALNANNVELRRAKAGVLIMQIRRPPTSAFITASGHVRCIKSTSEFEAKAGARRIARYIQKIYKQHPSKSKKPIRFLNFEMANVLATACLPMAVRMNPFSKKYACNGEPGTYEPEVFPGVTYKLPHFEASINIFSTGRLTVTAPNTEYVMKALNEMVPKILEFCRPRTEQELTNLQLQQLKRYIKKFDENFLERLIGSS